MSVNDVKLAIVSSVDEIPVGLAGNDITRFLLFPKAPTSLKLLDVSGTIGNPPVYFYIDFVGPVSYPSNNVVTISYLGVSDSFTISTLPFQAVPGVFTNTDLATMFTAGVAPDALLQFGAIFVVTWNAGASRFEMTCDRAMSIDFGANSTGTFISSGRPLGFAQNSYTFTPGVSIRAELPVPDYFTYNTATMDTTLLMWCSILAGTETGGILADGGTNNRKVIAFINRTVGAATVNYSELTSAPYVNIAAQKFANGGTNELRYHFESWYGSPATLSSTSARFLFNFTELSSSAITSV